MSRPGLTPDSQGPGIRRSWGAAARRLRTGIAMTLVGAGWLLPAGIACGGPPVVRHRPPVAGRSVTFFVTADTHFDPLSQVMRVAPDSSQLI